MITLEELKEFQDSVSAKAVLGIIDIMESYELDKEDKALTNALVQAFILGGTSALESMTELPIWG